MANVQIKSEKLTPSGGIFRLWSYLMHFSSNYRIDKPAYYYEKFYLYSIITHSKAIEGSTVTEVEALMHLKEMLRKLNRR